MKSIHPAKRPYLNQGGKVVGIHIDRSFVPKCIKLISWEASVSIKICVNIYQSMSISVCSISFQAAIPARSGSKKQLIVGYCKIVHHGSVHYWYHHLACCEYLRYVWVSYSKCSSLSFTQMQGHTKFGPSPASSCQNSGPLSGGDHQNCQPDQLVSLSFLNPHAGP